MKTKEVKKLNNKKRRKQLFDKSVEIFTKIIPDLLIAIIKNYL